MRVKLAWSNLTRNRNRFVATVVGIAFAVFIMLFQVGLFVGFVRAASKVIDSVDAGVVVKARGTPYLELGSSIDERFGYMAMGVPGVRQCVRVAAGMSLFKKPSGEQLAVAIVGSDPDAGTALPRPWLESQSDVTVPDAVVIDESNAATLGVTSMPADVEIDGNRARVLRHVAGFGSFLGSPYVFADLPEARRYLRLPDSHSTFLFLRLDPGVDPSAVSDELQRRFPEVDVLPKERFVRDASLYWVLQTGAGGALLTSAFLGFLVGVVFVSQTMYASTLEKIAEFATLRAMGASPAYVVSVVVLQAQISGLFGVALGLLTSLFMIQQARAAIPWVAAPPWLFGAMVIISFVMCALASIASVRATLKVEPARVFQG
jgi:putative ABC transport system permease protein